MQLPSSACLLREHRLPTTSRRRIPQILTLELSSNTPFAQEDVRWGYTAAPIPGTGQLLVRQLLVSRAMLDAELAKRGADQPPPTFVGIEAPDDPALAAINLLDDPLALPPSFRMPVLSRPNSIREALR